MKPLFCFKVLKGITVAVTVTLSLLCAFALLSVRAEDPQKYLSLYADIALFIGVALGGGVSARGSDSPLVNSLCCGAVCAVLLLLPSIVFSDWGAESLLRMSLTVASALIGGLVLRGREGNAARKQSVKRRKMIAKKYGAG